MPESPLTDKPIDLNQDFADAEALMAPLEADAITKSRELVRQTLLKIGPAVVRPSCILNLMESDPQDLEKIVNLLRQSPILSARVLGVVNSAAFGISKQVVSIERATALLGPSRTRAIALAYGLRAITERSGLPPAIANNLWANSLQKAVAARKFCEIVGPEHADSAYSLGLIQDIGLPMLVAADLDYYRSHINILTSRVTWTDHERERFGFDHTMIGQGLLAEWRASKMLQSSVLGHHTPPFDKLTDNVSILDLSVFFASLFPHMDEEPTPAALEWIHAIHARFLSNAYPTPDQFIKVVIEEVRRIRDNDPPVAATEQLIRKLINLVSVNSINITAKLCQIEQDVDQQRQGINDLKFQAFTDPLTKVLNRRGFTQLATRRIEMAAENGTGACCMLADLDDFKTINDTHGHDVGDMVLRGIARAIRRKLGANDLIGRLGGDEFAVLVTNVTRADAIALAKRVTESIEGKALRVREDLQLTAHFSLGAVYSEQDLDDLSIDNMLNLADQAMYQRKRSGKQGLVFKIHPQPIEPGGQNVMNPFPVARQIDRE